MADEVELVSASLPRFGDAAAILEQALQDIADGRIETRVTARAAEALDDFDRHHWQAVRDAWVADDDVIAEAILELRSELVEIMDSRVEHPKLRADRVLRVFRTGTH